MTWYAQNHFDIKFEWGPEGLQALKPYSDVMIIIDVLSFTTCVTAACEAGGLVYPFPWKDTRAEQFAIQHNATLAGRRGSGARFSLSPETLRRVSSGEKVVLPSPNGSQLSTETGTLPTIAACLRNASAAAAKAMELGQRISIIAAGERWHASETLRPALEDLLGAGAVIAALTGTVSPEAEAAATLFRATETQIQQSLLACASGKELIEIGFDGDVRFAAELNASQTVPVLMEGRYAGQ